jgi:CRP-like cAMP-binding protein
MASDPTITMLKLVPLFSGLSGREMKRLYESGRRMEIPRGREVVREGEPGLGFHLILEGDAAVVVDGKIRRHLGPGDYFGEISMIDRGPVTATIAAETDLTTFSYSYSSFKSMVLAEPEIAQKLLVALCGVVRAERRARMV